MDFPIDNIMDEHKCYHFLVDVFHPDGLNCPRCHTKEKPHVYHSYNEPVIKYRCSSCRCLFNAWKGTLFEGTHWRPSQVVLILRGFTQGVSTAQLAREL